MKQVSAAKPIAGIMLALMGVIADDLFSIIFIMLGGGIFYSWATDIRKAFTDLENMIKRTNEKAEDDDQKT